jgi:hypothetical protein
MLYAEIKKSSEHANQRSYHLDEKGKFVPFPVEINSKNAPFEGIVKGGVGGNYFLHEVILFIKDKEGKFQRVK